MPTAKKTKAKSSKAPVKSLKETPESFRETSDIAIRTFALDKLRPYEKNPRKNDHVVDRMVSSIKEFGFKIPILAKSDGSVIDGHLRLKAAKELGLKAVPAILCDDWTEPQIKAFRLLVNRSVSWADWDTDLLKLEFDELKEMDFDLSLTGFDLKEIDNLFESDHAEAEDATRDAPEEPVARRGDIWVLGAHRLMCGDSTVVTDVSRLMDGKRTSLICTDPPYLVDYKGGDHPASKSNSGKKNKDWSDKYREVDIPDASEFFEGFMAAAIAEAAHPDAAWYIWHASIRQGVLEQSMLKCGLFVHQQIIWAKSRAVLTYSHFMWAHEPCFYGWLKGNKPKLTPPVNTKSVWTIDNKIEDGLASKHPTQKPVVLFEDPVKWHTLPGDSVFEPFSGSGTMLIACEKSGRSCHAMELSPAFVDVAVKRWQDFTGRKATLESDGRTFEEIGQR